MEREIRPLDPIAGVLDSRPQAETRTPQPATGINSALGKAFNTAGRSSDFDMDRLQAIVPHEIQHGDMSQLNSAIQKMNETSENNIHMMHIAHNSEVSLHQNWMETKQKMKSEMEIAERNARGMAMATIRSEAD